jgi:hypothetical protein
LLARLPTPQAEGSPPVGYPLVLIQYIRSCSPYLEAVSSIRNLRTCHVVTRDPLNLRYLQHRLISNYHLQNVPEGNACNWTPCKHAVMQLRDSFFAICAVRLHHGAMRPIDASTSEEIELSFGAPYLWYILIILEHTQRAGLRKRALLVHNYLENMSGKWGPQNARSQILTATITKICCLLGREPMSVLFECFQIVVCYICTMNNK